jgi:hypothetical protein
MCARSVLNRVIDSERAKLADIFAREAFSQLYICHARGWTVILDLHATTSLVISVSKRVSVAGLPDGSVNNTSVDHS